jgi:integrase
MREYHGAVMARQSPDHSAGGMQLAVLAEVIDRSSVQGIDVRSKRRPKGAPVPSGEQLRELIEEVSASEDCQHRDLSDPIVMLAATALRRRELLGLRWSDYSRRNRTVTMSGKVIRAAGKGLMRVDETKTEDSARTVPLPKFAADVLNARHVRFIVGQAEVIFPSSVGAACLRASGQINSATPKCR